MKRHKIKKKSRFTKSIFVAILSFWKLLIKNQPFLTRPTLIDLNSDELCYHPFMVSLDTCDGSCNTFIDLSDRIRVSNKTKDEKLKVFNLNRQVKVNSKT